jgi:hypothetical protein
MKKPKYYTDKNIINFVLEEYPMFDFDSSLVDFPWDDWADGVAGRNFEEISELCQEYKGYSLENPQLYFYENELMCGTPVYYLAEYLGHRGEHPALDETTTNVDDLRCEMEKCMDSGNNFGFEDIWEFENMYQDLVNEWLQAFIFDIKVEAIKALKEEGYTAPPSEYPKTLTGFLEMVQYQVYTSAVGVYHSHEPLKPLVPRFKYWEKFYNQIVENPMLYVPGIQNRYGLNLIVKQVPLASSEGSGEELIFNVMPNE